MATAKTPLSLVRRAHAGVHVALSWPRVGELLVVDLHDALSGERFTLELPRSRALDALRCPYAYLAAARARAAHAGLDGLAAA